MMLAVSYPVMSPSRVTRSVRITQPLEGRQSEILTPEALDFLADLHRMFERRRKALLARRLQRQQQLDGGQLPDFLEETEDIRSRDWVVAPIPPDLRDRRVEITGPVDRKMVINALNSGANIFMADFEDSNAPTWANTIEGQANLKDAVRRNIEYSSPQGKHYTLGAKLATLVVRPRGWHLEEKHVLVNGSPMSAALFDFGLFFFHNAVDQLARGTAPYFYLPKLENHYEARLWNDVFLFAQGYLRLPIGSIRATVLIENILAAFEMDEILWELRQHSSGLNCGRWDYIFSFIKKFRQSADFVLPDRAQVTMDRHFLDSYVKLLIHTCHRRGIHAMGGMAAQIPIKSDADANEKALSRVREDKLREVHAGHDGTWVAHPGLVPVAREIFDKHMRGPNQIDRALPDSGVTAQDLIEVPDGEITAAGLRHNVDVGLRYLEAWLRGSGCVPIHHLMEDAATAEICRAQVWQWTKHGAVLDSGEKVSPALVKRMIRQELKALKQTLETGTYDPDGLALAAKLLEEMMTAQQLPEWLTAVAYRHLDS